MPSYTNVDTTMVKFQVVKAYDANGNFIDVIRDAPYLSGFKESINAACDALRVVLPRSIDAYDGLYQPGSKNTVVLGNNWQWWLYGAELPTVGLLKYSGIVDAITPKIDESGAETVEVLITPYSQRALGDQGISGTTVAFGTAGSSSTYIDTAVIFQSFFTGSYVNSSGATVSTIDPDTSKPYADPYTLDPTSTTATGQKTQFAFQSQNNLSSLTTTLQLGPANYYFRANQDKTAYFGQIPSSPTHTLILGQHITSIEYSTDNVPRKNVIIVQGKGVSGKYTGSSVSTLGKRVYYKSDNRITDAATAQLLANGIGAQLDREQVRAKVKIPDYRGDLLRGLGYDIELFKVGQTVKIVDGKAPSSSIAGSGSVWGSFVWGRDKWGAPGAQSTIWGSFTWGSAVWGASVGSIFNTLVTIMAIHYGWFYVELELGFRAPSLNRKLYDLEARFQDASLVS